MFYVFIFASYLAALFLPMPFFLALVCVIGVRYRGYTCLGVAALIDIHFSLSGGTPIYTLCAGSVLLIAEVLRPHLRIEPSV